MGHDGKRSPLEGASTGVNCRAVGASLIVFGIGGTGAKPLSARPSEAKEGPIPGEGGAGGRPESAPARRSIVGPNDSPRRAGNGVRRHVRTPGCAWVPSGSL
jgi:hypothetical protein